MTGILYGNIQELNRDKLKKIRKAFPISQKDLGKAIDISPSQIKNIELGYTGASIDSLVRIAKYLHVSTDYLLDITDDPGEYWKDKKY